MTSVDLGDDGALDRFAGASWDHRMISRTVMQ